VAVQTRIDERMVVDLWERQAFVASALGALGLHVVFRGLPSDAGGPDYQDAILSVEGKRLLTGDVEFHVEAADWYRHGHHLNPKYNRVILHVVWTNDAAETRREDGASVPVLALDRSEHLPALVTDTPSTSPLLPHPCVATFARLPVDRLLSEVRRLGIERFEARSSRFAADLAIEDADQVAYGALLEGLGYASNRRAFAELADAVPYAWLQSIPFEQRLATLLDAARLAPSAPVPPPAHLPAHSWRLARLRPANHPAQRLQGIVLLLARLAPSLAGSMEDAVAQAGRPSDLRRKLVVRDGDDGYIGAGRADELAVSVVLPLVAALNPSDRQPSKLFENYPSPPANRWTRHMLGLIQHAGHDVQRVQTASEHQGLHHLYHGCCREGNATACPLCRIGSARG
jgi:Protein of unknown function (DUF2851)